MDLISVIVPIYRVEQYLNKCIESIVNQTYQNLEIILVDDGSPDKCGKICDQWKKKDNRIKVIHKENGGLSDARNAGMRIATGEYIGFVDSDDWIDLTMYEKLYESIKKYSADIASCGVYKVFVNDNQTQMFTKKTGTLILDRLESMQSLIEVGGITQTVWNKLYKKEIVKNIEFPYGYINEDEFWTWKAISKVERTVTIENPLYFYYQRDGSIMSKRSIQMSYNFIQAKCERHQFIKQKLPELSNISSLDILLTCQYLGQLTIDNEQNNEGKNFLDELCIIVKSHRLEKKFLNSIGIKKRFNLFILQHQFKLCCLIRLIILKLVGINYQ